MHPDDDSQTTLSKWPFILGDVLLVVTALAIAILGQWQLTDWQVAACVAAVALGAALFVLPYIVEFQVRVREEREDRAADLRILKKHILNAEQDLSAFDARLRALESGVAEATQPNAALTEINDKKIAQLEDARSSQEEALDALQKKLEELPTEAPPAFDPEVLKPIEKRLNELEAGPVPTPEADIPASREEPSGNSMASSEGEAPPVEPKAPVAQMEHPKRAARRRHGPEEARLLRRAIAEKSENSSAAVSRIIGSKTKEKVPEADPKPDSEDAGDAPSEAEGPGMLFDEEKITSPVIRTKAKKNDAVVTASVFFGIGNKPYLRGSGGGLSWETGQVMEFEEIGKWRWVAPADVDSVIEVQVYCNDEEPDQSGKYALEPGQKLELSPVF